MPSEEVQQARAAMLGGAANGETAATASASAAAAATAAAVAAATADATAAATATAAAVCAGREATHATELHHLTAELAARDEEMARLRAELHEARGAELGARGELGVPCVASSEFEGNLEDLRAELLEARCNLERCEAELATSRRAELGTQEAAEARGWCSTELTCLAIELAEAEAAAAAAAVTAATVESETVAAAEVAAVAAAAASLRGQRWAYEIVELKQQLITEQAARATVEAMLAAGQGEQAERGEGSER
eukprot:scaffold109713_cov54-Phaeocystis_antarctica.AAC.2